MPRFATHPTPRRPRPVATITAVVAATAALFAGSLVGCQTPPTSDGTTRTSMATPSEHGEPPLEATRWSGTTPVGQVVAERPDTARILELVGIDYCCGGDRTLADAAAARRVDLNRLLGALAVVGSVGVGEDMTDWRSAPLADLIDHIVDIHHAELRRDLPRLAEIVATVARVHGEEDPRLTEVRQVFDALRAELEVHMALEENEAFPAILMLDRDRAAVDIEALLVILHDDHEEAGAALGRLHALTDGFTAPEHACALYREMVAALAHLERQTFTHIHLENNILFPRVMALIHE